jgi:hypothetical protein
MCGGALVVLGTLGEREHLKCRDCGIMFNRVIESQSAFEAPEGSEDESVDSEKTGDY